VEIVTELKKKGHEFDRRDIELADFKEAGEYDIKVKLPGDVYASVKLVLELAVKKEKKSAAKKKTTTKEETEAAAKEADESVTDEKKAEPESESSVEETKETKEKE